MILPLSLTFGGLACVMQLMPQLALLFAWFVVIPSMLTAAVSRRRRQIHIVSADEFEQLGLSVIGTTKRARSEKRRRRRFRNHFGVDPKYCAIAWVLLQETNYVWWHYLHGRPDPKHLMWALLFLKKVWYRGRPCSQMQLWWKNLSQMVVDMFERHC